MQDKLQAYKLVKAIISKRETDLIQRWRGSVTPEGREQAWFGLRELDILAGAIEDGIRKHSDTE